MSTHSDEARREAAHRFTVGRFSDLGCRVGSDMFLWCGFLGDRE